MESKANALLHKINLLEEELLVELRAKEQQFRFTIRNNKVRFTAAATAEHQKLAKKVRNYLLHARWLSYVTSPIILSCIVPAALLDLWATVYQFICFPAYGIPKVRRRDYLLLDRNYLSYLNSIERFNCAYCGYVNGLMAYVQEIAGRTEQYWCPIKHALRLKTRHSRYSHFLDYGDAEGYRRHIEQVRRDFKDLKAHEPAPSE